MNLLGSWKNPSIFKSGGSQLNKDQHMQGEYRMIMHSKDFDKLDRFVRDYGANCEINGASLLFWAVYSNKSMVVNRLLELGADPNCRNEFGASCLSLACFYGFVDVLKTLIDHGANIDFGCVNRAYYGWDGHIQVEILKVLREYGWINLYLDDLRDIPKGFVGARTVGDAIELISKNKVHILSLDHDLGMNDKGELEKTGYDFVKWICERGIRPANKIYIHTDNIVGKENMYETLKAACRRGFIDKDIEIYPYPIVKNRYSRD